MTTEQRFWGRVRKTKGCWKWKGSTTGSMNYGQFYDGTRKVLAHRYSWGLAHGPIPSGLCVLHKCDVPACVNPEHLWLGTKADNTRDMVQKGRAWLSHWKDTMRRSPKFMKQRFADNPGRLALFRGRSSSTAPLSDP